MEIAVKDVQDSYERGFGFFRVLLITLGRIFFSLVVSLGIAIPLHEVFHMLAYRAFGGGNGRIVFLPQLTEPLLAFSSWTPFAAFVPLDSFSGTGIDMFLFLTAGGLGTGIFFLLLVYFLSKKKTHWEYLLVMAVAGVHGVVYGLLEPLYYYYPGMIFVP